MTSVVLSQIVSFLAGCLAASGFVCAMGVRL